jgi:hypothetical protein
MNGNPVMVVKSKTFANIYNFLTCIAVNASKDRTINRQNEGLCCTYCNVKLGLKGGQ